MPDFPLTVFALPVKLTTVWPAVAIITVRSIRFCEGLSILQAASVLRLLRFFFAYGGAFGKVPGESRISIFYFMAFLTDLNHSPHTKGEVIFMSKTKKPHPESEHGKHTAFPASIINGNTKPKKDEANPLIPGAMGKVYHGMPHNGVRIPGAFPAIDNDLAVENMANDFNMTAADLQELP